MNGEIKRLKNENAYLKDRIKEISNDGRCITRYNLKDCLIRQLKTDEGLDKFIKSLPDDINLVDRISVDFIFNPKPISEEIYRDLEGITREIIPKNERIGYKPRKQYLKRDRYGLHKEDDY